jgi:hypothetical protein
MKHSFSDLVSILRLTGLAVLAVACCDPAAAADLAPEGAAAGAG